ncbi:MAG: phosphoribosylformylglycinamidine synthase subunit PurQ [Microthrixaceae bacterium]
MAPVVAVIRFPGTNCEFDTAEVLADAGAEPRLVFHAEESLDGVDAVVLPGGFAHGDYLRPGAIARFSPIMPAVSALAEAGRPVVGICNGFQVLCEAGLLPGALQKNARLKFVCGPSILSVEGVDTPLTRGLEMGRHLSIPVNHFEGNYTVDPATLTALRAQDRIVFRYVNNPNGSMDDIAGVCNEARNVVGLMPHPERAAHELLGSTDGRVMMEALVESAALPVPA